VKGRSIEKRERMEDSCKRNNKEEKGGGGGRWKTSKVKFVVEVK
jgi:hypothetical protein